MRQSGLTVRKRTAGALTAALLLVACGDDDENARQNQALLPDGARVFSLTHIDGAEVDADDRPFGWALTLSNSSPPAYAYIVTPCGTANALRVEVTDTQLVTSNFSTHFHPARCTEDQRASAERAAAVLASNPDYEFDGNRLVLAGDDVSLTFELSADLPPPTTAS